MNVRNQSLSVTISNSMLGMILFVLTELMFFLALLSAYFIIKSRHGNWTPPLGIRLPIEATAVNTVILVISGVMVFLASHYARKNFLEKAWGFLGYAHLFGSSFLLIQGYEWIRLIQHGLTLRDSLFGACFFLLIGSHGLHALGGLLAMGHWLYHGRTKKQAIPIHSLSLFWGFIVLLWPLLYGIVYF